MFTSRAVSRSFAAPLLAQPDARYALENARTGEVLVQALEAAFTRKERNHGLLGRTSLEPGEGLLIAPCSSVHTWFMKFAIDVIFVASDGRVRKIARAVPPWRFALGFGSFAVVELPAQVAAATEAGDTLVLATRAAGS